MAERIVLRIGSAKKMSGKIQHTWNVICVKKFTYPMPKPIEFRVVSKTHLGASIKANNTMFIQIDPDNLEDPQLAQDTQL